MTDPSPIMTRIQGPKRKKKQIKKQKTTRNKKKLGKKKFERQNLRQEHAELYQIEHN